MHASLNSLYLYIYFNLELHKSIFYVIFCHLPFVINVLFLRHIHVHIGRCGQLIFSAA